MNDFSKHVVLIICLVVCAVCVFMGIRQVVVDQRGAETDYTKVSWEPSKLPYYQGGSTYRAPSRQSSTVTMPSVSPSSQRLFHHHAGNTYAGQGTGTYRGGYAQTGYSRSYASSAGRPVRTFSNGAVHSYGSSGSGGGMTGLTSHRKASYSGGSAGYTTPSISISIPHSRSYAYNNVQGTSTETPVRQAMPGRRKVAPDYDGEDGELAPDTEDDEKWWYWNEGDWTTDIPMGLIRMGDGGVVYRWNGTSWETENDQEELDSPIGNVPWILLLLMTGGYAVLQRQYAVRQKKQAVANYIERRI